MLIEAILERSNPGDVVLDPFGGWGSTLIASERVHRRARLIESSPTGVDAIVRRWERFCGGRAVLVESGQPFAEVAEVRARGDAVVEGAKLRPILYHNQHEFVLVYKIADGRCASNFAHNGFGGTRSDVWRYAGCTHCSTERLPSMASTAPHRVRGSRDRLQARIQRPSV
jgi:hypothetical protein